VRKSIIVICATFAAVNAAAAASTGEAKSAADSVQTYRLITSYCSFPVHGKLDALDNLIHKDLTEADYQDAKRIAEKRFELLRQQGCDSGLKTIYVDMTKSLDEIK
jgi:hypothetical protein